MRDLIIGFSVLFLILSGVVTYKTSRITSHAVHNPDNRQIFRSDGFLLDWKNIAGQSDKGLPSKQAPLKSLQLRDADAGTGYPDRSERSQADIKAGESQKRERVLGVFGDGMFRPGQFGIDSNQKSAIEKLVPVIRQSADYRVIIEGYTDTKRPSGGKRYVDNMELSFLRAKAVALILVKGGISMERISVIGYGDTRPVASNDTIEGRAKNRRVEVKLLPGKKDF
jgi:flagellar motor protein MotB